MLCVEGSTFTSECVALSVDSRTINKNMSYILVPNAPDRSAD